MTHNERLFQGENIINTTKHLFALQASVLVLLVSILACSVPPYYSVPTVPSPYDIYVTATGNDANSCRTLAQACRTVTGGVGKAVAGSTVIIGVGTFSERAVMVLSIPINFRGAGQAATLISSAGGGVFQILSGAGYPVEVHMQDLAIANFVATNHSAVFNSGGTLAMTRVTIQNNAHAGLLNFGGTVMLNNGEILDNGDAGIFSNAVLQVTNSRLRRNANSGISNSGVAVIEGTTLEQNRSGGIINYKHSDATGDYPGTLTITSSIVSNNVGTGVTNQGGHVTISASAIDTNAGAGVLNQDGVLLLGNSEVARNQGRGVDIDDLTPPLDSVAEITQTALINNTLPGLYVGNGVARLTNVTVSGNAAGIRMAHGSLTLAYSTVAYNTAWGIRLDNTDASAVLQNSIVAVNGAAGQNCLGPGTRTLDPATINFACSDSYTAAYLHLGPLVEDPDTRIYVIPLQFDSLAKDTASGACPPVDHRGVARPFGPACDVGAYEFRVAALEYATPEIIELLPSETPTPGVIRLLLDKNANCRHGPGSVYPVLTSVLAGQTVQLIGRNTQNTWWLSIIPGDFQCWISSGSGQPEGDSGLLPVLPDPPTPIPTTETGTGGTDFDKDGYNSDKDCNDKDAKIHPGAAETPDDKVDSNCNGNDDD